MDNNKSTDPLYPTDVRLGDERRLLERQIVMSQNEALAQNSTRAKERVSQIDRRGSSGQRGKR